MSSMIYMYVSDNYDTNGTEIRYAIENSHRKRD